MAGPAARPAPRLDRKTSEHVDLLFSVRVHPVGKTYINRTIIPALCAKAGARDVGVRGNITSHRARSTIASQLYNAKEPMTLFELQAWLGTGTRPPPSTTRRSPRTRSARPTQRPGTSPATSAPSRIWGTPAANTTVAASPLPTLTANVSAENPSWAA